jgi:hypothetical protein
MKKLFFKATLGDPALGVSVTVIPSDCSFWDNDLMETGPNEGSR